MFPYYKVWASPKARLAKNPPAVQETQCLCLEGPMEEIMATHSSILA